ncbi:flagellar hook-basal body protein [Planctomycetes bacterium K23_9]|uniref:Flagellar basal-body rod protein FlgF n=1 Tax=Stieleria marina TaxID=1930275 RepID=A0A517NT16_9BACT|nr:Flagellar basal-body rod protein FlgF [Planctomycetes bacterium K23_9]
MINGLFSGAAAMDTLSRKQEVISSNLAHATTSGHRRVQASVKQPFDADNLDSTILMGPEIESYASDFSPGRQVQTGRPLDVSIAGDGFFAFDNSGGTGDSEYLSRNGRLFREPESNLLVNEEGFPIQGMTGAITIDPTIGDQDVVIAADGTVSADGNVLGQIRTVTFEDNQTLIPLGVAGFVPGVNSVVSEQPANVQQHQHELSNVQPVNELVALIANNRQYEAVQKATTALSESLREYIRA